MVKIVLKVKSSSPVKELSESIFKCYQENPNRTIVLRGIGAGAVNQMYKALAVSSGLFAQRGLEQLIKAGFEDVIIGDNEDKKTSLIAILDIK